MHNKPSRYINNSISESARAQDYICKRSKLFFRAPINFIADARNKNNGGHVNPDATSIVPL